MKARPEDLAVNLGAYRVQRENKALSSQDCNYDDFTREDLAKGTAQGPALLCSCCRLCFPAQGLHHKPIRETLSHPSSLDIRGSSASFVL